MTESEASRLHGCYSARNRAFFRSCRCITYHRFGTSVSQSINVFIAVVFISIILIFLLLLHHYPLRPQRVDRIRSPPQNPLYRERGVEPRHHGPSDLLHRRNRRLRRARDDDIDRCAQLLRAVGQELDPVFDLAHAIAIRQLFDRDRTRRIDAALVDPGLDAREVERLHVDGEDIHEASGAVHDFQRCLSALEPTRDFSMLFLTLVSTP